MGRPLNKRYFGTGSGDQIKVRAKVGTNPEGDGFIVKQRGSKKFKVNVGGNIGDCFLVDKNNGSLGPNEMTITVQTDDGSNVRAVKISAHRVSTAPGTSYAWTFDGSFNDGKVEMSEVETGVTPIIYISVDVPNRSVTAPAGTTFGVTATVTQGATLSYLWQVSTDSGDTWNTATGGVYSGETTNTLTISDSTGLNGNLYRVLLNATGGATEVRSGFGTLTVA